MHHTDGEREYAYDHDPVLGSSTGQILAAAAEQEWTVIDMAVDWKTCYPLEALDASAAVKPPQGPVNRVHLVPSPWYRP